MLDFSALWLEKAREMHVQAICDLVNLTYRGDTGWTTEAAIIQGNRTNHQEVKAALYKPDADFFVMHRQNQMIACIYIAKENAHAFIGFFSVHPDWQGKGLGSYLLAQTEIYAKGALGINKLLMFVISQRSELLSYYQRRGYRSTGRVEAYPLHLGVPKVTGLTIDYLEKTI
jgi:GNAT superfamily N-acetyltransferase